MTYDGVVLAGGKASRLGGVNKPAVVVGGRQLLDIALAALAGADAIVAVGAPMPTGTPVHWTREEPIGTGPVAALAAALQALPHRDSAPESVVVLAADLPFVTPAAVAELVAAQTRHAAALAIDATGRDQPLLACYDVVSLTAAIPAEPAGGSMRALIAALEAAGAVGRVSLAGDPPPTLDCDTAADLIRAEALA